MPDTSLEVGEMAGLGQWLLTRRLAKGISLQQAADVTRICKVYIDALENEDFTRLPSPAYCKGFIRIYAGYLGISPDEAVARYEALVSAPVEIVSTQGSRMSPAEPDLPKTPYQRWALPLLLLIVVIGLSFLIDTDQRPPLNRPAPQPAIVQPALPASVQTVSSSARQITAQPAPLSDNAVQNSATTPTVAISAGDNQTDGLILKLKVNQDSWLNVDIDGLLSKQYDLKAGDVIEWKAENTITLDIGNAGGVEGELNGKPLPAFGSAGKVAHTVLRAEGAAIR